MKPIFEYTDFRKYLSDYYHYKKETSPGFSHRLFLGKAGMSGPNFLKNVIDGKKNLSPSSIKKFSTALGLAKKETKFFSLLVQYNQAKTSEKKQRFFTGLSQFSHRSEIQKIRKDQYNYLSDWRNIAVREYIHAHKFLDDYSFLAKAITPKISPRQAKKSVELLLSLGLIRTGADGHYEVSDRIISTGTDINSLAARELHKAMMEISCGALDSIPADRQYFRTIIGSFSDNAFGMIKLELDATRKKMLDLIAADNGSPKKVHAFGMQLFPMERGPKRRGRQK
ncbi:MAG TPA: TIGR02147 family protein [Chitinivibrionales bacterium]|nr:TIGR02147 family protein [Chitinivibrionales bacterium]